MTIHATPKLPQKIHEKFKASPGAILSANDFSLLGSRAAIDQALSRMASKGVICRVGHGLYHCPQVHPEFGALVPTTAAITSALSAKAGLLTQPAGAYAANLLGLSEQVPRRLVLLTDGASRTLQVAGQPIVLRHTTPRNMAAAGRVSGLFIQALRHLGQAHVEPELLAQLSRRLSAKDKAILAEDAGLAPAWIAKTMRAISGKGQL